MTARQGPAERGAARGRSLVADLSRAAEQGRLGHSLSYAEVGRAIHLSDEQAARIFRGESPNVSVVRLAQILAVVGLDLSARAFPGGPPVRDRAQRALLERLRARLHLELEWRTEVPVIALPMVGATDLRAWDATVRGTGWTIGVEAETHIRDAQAVARRLALKQRDGAVDHAILLLSDTRWHRELVRDSPTALFGDSISARSVLRALKDGRCPIGNAVVLL
jgi:transcriptional regulator with XRE-family HTH domain